MPSTNTATEHKLMIGLRNKDSGISGSIALRFGSQEYREHHDGERQQRFHARGAPAVVGHPREREQQRHDAQDERDQPRPIDAPLDALGMQLGKLEVNRRDRDQAHRHVHVERRAP